MYEKLDKYIDENGVIAINGPFGVGKTTFLEQYKKRSINTKFITFNAWEFDFSENPKTAFLLGVYKGIYENLPKEEKLDILWEKGWKNIWALVKNGLKSKGVSNEGALINEEVEFKKYVSTKKLIDSIKENIQTICEKYKTNAVLIIDDLDRARPDFSLEIFEIAKHIFDVENLSIILVYNKHTMNEIVKLKFGVIKGEGYLDKYINRRIDFEEEGIQKVFLKPVSSKGETILATFIKQLALFFPVSRRVVETVLKQNHCIRIVQGVEHVGIMGIGEAEAIFRSITIFFRWFIKDDPFERRVKYDGTKTIRIKKEYRGAIQEVWENSWIKRIESFEGYSKIHQLIHGEDFIKHHFNIEDERIQVILEDNTI
ncbi:MAG: AAA family ATPase [Mycoplasmatales bacterium]|nr:AAA family ATPase [Mycoplasmatales bacterium]